MTVMMKPVEGIGETPSHGITETADLNTETADAEWIACRQRVQAMARCKNVIKIADIKEETADTEWIEHKWIVGATIPSKVVMEVDDTMVEMADGWTRGYPYDETVKNTVQIEMAAKMWTSGFLLALQAVVKLIQWLHDMAIILAACSMNFAKDPGVDLKNHNKCKMKGCNVTNPKKDTRKEAEKQKPKTVNTYEVKPKDGAEAQVKTINNVECSWCNCCQQWLSGDKSYSTTEHKAKSELQGDSTSASLSSIPAGNLAAGLFRKRLLTMVDFHGAGHALLFFAMFNSYLQAHKPNDWNWACLWMPLGFMMGMCRVYIKNVNVSSHLPQVLYCKQLDTISTH